MWLKDVSVAVNMLHAADGRVVRTRQFAKTDLGYCLDEDSRRTLALGGEGNLVMEWPVAGGVKMHTKFAARGKATLHLIKRHVMLCITCPHPRQLEAWLRALQSGGRPSTADDLAKRPLGRSSMSNANASSSKISPAGLPKKKSCERASPGLSGLSPIRRAPPELSPASKDRLTPEQQKVRGAGIWGTCITMTDRPCFLMQSGTSARQVLLEVLDGKSVFFTGGAGTGKSFLLKEILRRLPAASTFATATTGIAACAIGGVVRARTSTTGHCPCKTAKPVSTVAPFPWGSTLPRVAFECPAFARRRHITGLGSEAGSNPCPSWRQGHCASVAINGELQRWGRCISPHPELCLASSRREPLYVSFARIPASPAPSLSPAPQVLIIDEVLQQVIPSECIRKRRGLEGSSKGDSVL